MFEFIKTLKNWTICLFLWVCHILFRKVEKAPIDVVSSESVCKSTIQSDNYQNSEHSGDPSNLILVCNKENNKEAKDEDNRENVKIKPIVHSGTNTQGPNEKEQIVELPQGENNSSSSTAHIDQVDIQNVTNLEINTTQEEEREQRTWNDSDRKLDRKRRFHSTNEQLNFDSNLPQIEREEAMKEFEYFWKSHSPFSQWYLSDFTLYSITFNCAEQHMMYQKAMLFGDEETAHKVLQEKEPREQKKLGRLVKNFDQEKWNKNCLKIVESGNRAKFLQNEDLKEEFLKTYPKTFVEASPYDTIWGIGLEDDDPRAWNRGTWRGQNLLGKALTKVRDEFMRVDTDLNDFSFSHNETIGNQEDISDNEFVNEKKPINDVNTDEENKEDYSRSNNSVRITSGVHPAVMIKTESILMTKDSSDFDKTQNDDDMIRENAKQNEDISTEKESCLHNRKEKITETKEKEDEATRNVSFLDIDGKTIREKGLASEEPIGSLNFFNEKNLNKTERVIENEDISTSDESNQDSTNSEKENMNKTKENTQRIGSLKTEKENVIETTQKTDEFTEKDSRLEINELKENDLTSDESTKITGRFDSMLTNKLVAIKSMSTSDESDLKNTENYSLQETPHSKVDSTHNKSITESSDYPNRNVMFSEIKRSHAEPFVENKNKNEIDTCDSTVETPGSTKHQKEMVEDNTRNHDNNCSSLDSRTNKINEK